MRMKSKDGEPKRKAPVWVWAFVAACGAIPIVTLGGAIPAMLGGFGATACYGLARDGKGTRLRRILSCCAVTLVAWGVLGTVVWVVRRNQAGSTTSTSTSSSGSKTVRIRTVNGRVVSREESTKTAPKDASELTERERRAIYADATKRRLKIEDKEDQIAEYFAAGRSVRVLEMQLETLEKMHVSHLERVAKRNRLTADELDALIEEGDRAEWPYADGS